MYPGLTLNNVLQKLDVCSKEYQPKDQITHGNWFYFSKSKRWIVSKETVKEITAFQLREKKSRKFLLSPGLKAGYVPGDN